MSDHQLSITAVWSDSDILEIELAVSFKAWSGAERAYVTRDELRGFADSLDAVAAGGADAVLDVGQPDLGHATCRVFEYGGPRHLGMELVVGHAGGHIINGADYPRELRLSVPIERGQLPAFARAVRMVIVDEKGSARLPVPTDWPS